MLELDEYENILYELNQEIRNKINQNSTFLPYLKHDIDVMVQQINRIAAKTKRSLDIIGSAWKWVAGSSDHEAHQIFLAEMNELAKNNNNQIIINRNIVKL